MSTYQSADSGASTNFHDENGRGERPSPPNRRISAEKHVGLIVRVERAFIRDYQVPLAADIGMDDGWRMIPVQPTADPGWQIDKSYDSDKRTGWFRYLVVLDGETRRCPTAKRSGRST
jgi:hypothetical protein